MTLAQGKRTIRSVAGDYLLLTKPWIVLLLITTTFCAMLIAARGLPPLGLVVLTLIGGACAAGGANALNSVHDWRSDQLMERTARRPIPAGRISPRNGLLFALGLCATAVLVLGFGVNWLSALLALAGIIYYAFVYTVLLKRATPQNIVVGGGAGAIPPLVGWAAVTGDLSLLSLYLFAIILLWTPPHTWALMLLIEKDYARAQIPMMPVAWGADEARWQSFLYSIALFVVTLIPFSFRELGIFYLLSALLLGGWFLYLAWRLLRLADKAAARRLYKYSNYYLALLFLAMVVDVVWEGLSL
ncbi:MAG: protoheme IX farnesyltransferase [Chloroflexi bacterium]|nr:protoheme IX farnesyltransferase [Chloroflexota bacterium]MBI3732926.1 protoheme IX farnesyltransferase [Chloroflexota bacterium]